ncbi:Gfo/Idh/MocA family protein [Synechococcus sp. Cruz CV-v-12]|uniref:Gfo/Idh/MocA family protein n=1 Tax=Synechococcus sp. Cruz CV-v-12 TaxID=2823728 RepID=UPI0020CDD285|nr:Gfo/Idh/MocA family oxidoreductase [Synechococcus sp. Cruz CV-v-12]MCP9874714.1 Gfo/Idh/MocA family oxidoreductase [Synechococcus sp. Cruz CV-v-12]
MRKLTLLASLFLCSLHAIAPAQTASPAPTVDPAPVPIFSIATGPLRIGVVGLVHGHVEGLLWQSTQRSDLKIVGIYDPDRALFVRLAAKYKLDPALYHGSLPAMLDAARPEAVSVMTSIKDHRMVADACAPRSIHMLFEKPLAFSNDDARHIANLARQHRVLALTNYETSWYASLREAKRLVDSGDRAPIRKLVFRHGHKGPKEIGCSPEFLAWLTEADQNGGGAVVDFGCYGAVLSTWLMNGERPTSVTASVSTLKPTIYPRVDDDATIILTYPTATATIQASWAWTHDNKETDIHTERGSIHAAKWDDLHTRDENGPLKPLKPAPKPADLDNEWTYLRQVVRGNCPIDPLSSLELNLIAVEILDAARNAAATPARR